MSENPGSTADRVEALLDEMTLEEQVTLLSGEDFWSVPAIDRLNIGKLIVTDGPNGARGGGSFVGGPKSASFPVGIALGASWNPALVEEVGVALAEEAKSKGAHVLLAPTVNIQRTVTNGRNFECYSEDPVLSAALAVGFVKGVQSRRIATTIKHFVGNESETERMTMSSVIDERTLREVYLLPFEWAVKKAESQGIMTSYNRLNGTYTCESKWLLDDVLRGQWKFDGFVVSDWFGSHDTVKTVSAGLDLEMPGPTRHWGEKLISAVEAGEVERATVRARARNILKALVRTGAIDNHGERIETSDDRPAHRALIRRAGAESAVLLKNDGVLPLVKSKKVAVIGPNAKVARIMGGGSSQLNPHYAISPWDGLVEALGEDRLLYAQGCTNDLFEPLIKTAFKAEYFANLEFEGEPVFRNTFDEGQTLWVGEVAQGEVSPRDFSVRLTAEIAVDETGTYSLGLSSAGRSRAYVDGELVVDAWTDWKPGHTFFEQGCDEVRGGVDLEAGRVYTLMIEVQAKQGGLQTLTAFRVGLSLPLGDDAIDAAVKAAGEADVALLFVGRNGEWDCEGADLPHIQLPGRQNELIAAVTAANPDTVVVLQTGGPVEMPWADDVPAILQAWYPGQEAGNAIADVLLGKADPGGRLPQTFPKRLEDNPSHTDDPKTYPGTDGEVVYREGVFIGYRHYERQGITPAYPFGHGLSYTRFTLTDPVMAAEGFERDGKISVSLTVTNTGDRDGICVVQGYVSPAQAPVDRPEQELKAFTKLQLEAGAQRRIELDFDARCFAFFDEERGLWSVVAGEYGVRIGGSATDTPIRLTVSRETALDLTP